MNYISLKHTVELGLRRDLSIDLIKIVSMFAVIGLHTFKASDEWRIANIFYDTGAVAIPLFFMVSGCLLFGRANIDWYYIKKKIRGIIRFVLILSLVVWFVKSFVSLQFSPIKFAKLFVGSFLQRGDLKVCWYLGAMAILYSSLPFLNQLYVNRRKLYLSLLVALFLLNIVVFIANIVTTGVPFEMRIIQTFRLWNWLFYFMLGGAIKNIEINLCHKTFYCLILLVLIVNVIFQESLKPIVGSPYCEYFYCSFVVILLSSMIFVCVHSVKIYSSKIIDVLSSLFLPVYVSHPFVIKGLEKYVPIVANSPYLLFVSVSLLTVIVAYCLMRISIFKFFFRI